MFQNESDVHAFLQARKKLGVKLGLERMNDFLETLGDIHHRLKVIHVAGTNGKGSTISYVQSVLTKAGYAIGCFTSPYLESYREQLLVNGEQMMEEDFVQLFNELYEKLSEYEQGEQKLTEFELLTVAAFLYFAKYRPVDLVLVEAGMGGRDDATNVCLPIVTAITNVAYDHERFLGDSLQAIAEQKAGIIKNGVPLITTAEAPEAIAVIERVANEKRAKLYEIHKHFRYESLNSRERGESFQFHSQFIDSLDVTISMLGEHQVKNATLALMIIDYLQRYYAFVVEREHIVAGLSDSRWTGRGEIVSHDPLVLIDGAHNRAGMEQLAKLLQRHFADKNIYLIIAMTNDKNVNDVLEPLYPFVKEICFTEFEHERAMTAEQLFDDSTFSKKVVEKAPLAAVKWKMLQLEDEDMLLVTGSLYFLARLRKIFVREEKS